jgi:predicted ATP-dependent protease
MSNTRAERAKALEVWAERVDAEDLKEADTSALREIAELAEQRAGVEAELEAAVVAARKAKRSWSEIGSMLGVSKQAAQRKYASKVSA